MTCDGEKIWWGAAGGETLFGLVQSKRVGNGGSIDEGLDRLGSCRRIGVRDRHKTISVTATATDGVNEDNIPQVGDTFMVPVNGRDVEFRCQSASLDIRVEDAAVVRISGRTLGEHPAPPTVNSFRNMN